MQNINEKMGFDAEDDSTVKRITNYSETRRYKQGASIEFLTTTPKTIKRLLIRKEELLE